MTAARGVALGALAVALVVLVVVLVGGGGTSKYDLIFPSAGQLVVGDEVQVGGRAIGSVEQIELTDRNQARVEISVGDEFAPLHEGTRALIRPTSLPGVANRYVTLTPGPNDARELEDGTTIPAESNTAPVDLDTLFATLDPPTRRGLSRLIRGFGTQYAGREKEVNAGFRYLGPAISSTQRLASQLVSDQAALTTLLRSGNQVTGAIAERRDDLEALVSDANAANSAIAAESTSLSRALRALPPTLRRANTTFVNLRATLDDLDDLVDVSKPATRRLAPFLRELRPVVTAARPTVADLRDVVSRPGEHNDLNELLRETPTVDRRSKPAIDNTIDALREILPILRFARPYAPEIVGAARGIGNLTANYDANGHYARVAPWFGTFTFSESAAGGTLSPTNRASSPLAQQSLGNVRRCPGGASQPQADGSSPYRDSDGTLDCDPGANPAGP